MGFNRPAYNLDMTGVPGFPAAEVPLLLPPGDEKGADDDCCVPVVNIKSALETSVLLPPKESSI